MLFRKFITIGVEKVIYSKYNKQIEKQRQVYKRT